MMLSKNISVLVVEDDYNHKEALKGYLQNLGYFKIVFARSSQEALELCTEHNIMLAFLDIGLVDSELDGIELGKQINQRTDAAIIFTSSFTDKTTLDRSDDVKHQIYLPKPLRERDVKVAIDKALKEKAKAKVLVRTTSNGCVFRDQEEEIYIKGNDKYYKKVHVQDIIFIRADSGGVNVHTVSNGILFTYTTLASFLRQYNHPDIIKIHNGHAANKRHVISKSDSILRMTDGTDLTIGIKWKQSIAEHFHMIKPK